MVGYTTGLLASHDEMMLVIVIPGCYHYWCDVTHSTIVHHIYTTQQHKTCSTNFLKKTKKPKKKIFTYIYEGLLSS